MKSFKRFIIEAESKHLYRMFLKKISKIQNPDLKKDLKLELRRGYSINLDHMDDGSYSYYLAKEKKKLDKMDELLLMSL